METFGTLLATEVNFKTMNEMNVQLVVYMKQFRWGLKTICLWDIQNISAIEVLYESTFTYLPTY